MGTDRGGIGWDQEEDQVVEEESLQQALATAHEAEKEAADLGVVAEEGGFSHL